MDKQREMFEKRFHNLCLDTCLDEEGDVVYIDDLTQGAWLGWQAAQKAQWQPIETAPKDGTSFVGYMNYEGYIHAELAHVGEDGCVYATNDNDGVAYTPWKHASLWTALPQEPTE